MSQDRHYCGCCGGEMETQTQVWCNRCKAHVLPDVPFWDATWYAQHEKYCPFTVTQFIPWNKKELKERGLLKRRTSDSSRRAK